MICVLWDIFSTQLACCDIYLILQLRKQASVQKTRRGLCIELTMHFCLGLEHEVLKTTSELCEAELCSCLLSEAASLDLITVIVSQPALCLFVDITPFFNSGRYYTTDIDISIVIISWGDFSPSSERGPGFSSGLRGQVLLGQEAEKMPNYSTFWPQPPPILLTVSVVFLCCNTTMLLHTVG